MSEMTYRQAGDYQIPNLQLENEGEKPLGKYGRMRRAFLEQNNPMLLNDMIQTESLFPHLWEIEETAKARVEFLMAFTAVPRAFTVCLVLKSNTFWKSSCSK